MHWRIEVFQSEEIHYSDRRTHYQVSRVQPQTHHKYPGQNRTDPLLKLD